MISLAKALPGIGCGDNSCRWGARGGMGTNGGCRCFNERPRDEEAQKQARQLIDGIHALRTIADSPDVLAALRLLVEQVRANERAVLAAKGATP